MHLTVQLILNGLAEGSLYGLIGVGFSTVYSVSRVLHFAHAGVLLMTAYVILTMNVFVKQGLVVSTLVGCIAAVALGVSIEVWGYRPMRQRGATAVSLFVASLGIMIVLANAAAAIFGAQTRFLRNGPVLNGPTVGGLTLATPLLVGLIVGVIACIGFALLLRTGAGIVLRGVTESPYFADLSGIRRHRVQVVTIAIASLMLVPVALVLLLSRGVSPGLGDDYIFFAIVATFIGGVGKPYGAFLGGYFVGFADAIALRWLPSGWQTAIAFGVLFVFLLARPQGIVGLRVRGTYV